MLSDEELAEDNRRREAARAEHRRVAMLMTGRDEHGVPFPDPAAVAAKREEERLLATDWPAALAEAQEERQAADDRLERAREATARLRSQLASFREELAGLEARLAADDEAAVGRLVEWFAAGEGEAPELGATGVVATIALARCRVALVERAYDKVVAQQTTAERKLAAAEARVAACERDGIAARRLYLRREKEAADARWQDEYDLVGSQ